MQGYATRLVVVVVVVVMMMMSTSVIEANSDLYHQSKKQSVR